MADSGDFERGTGIEARREIQQKKDIEKRMKMRQSMEIEWPESANFFSHCWAL